jgi:hypothetical protein
MLKKGLVLLHEFMLHCMEYYFFDLYNMKIGFRHILLKYQLVKNISEAYKKCKGFSSIEQGF